MLTDQLKRALTLPTYTSMHSVTTNTRIGLLTGEDQLKLALTLAMETIAMTHFIIITDLCTAEDIAYAREKYIGSGFDYEAAKAPEAQKKVG